MKVALKQKSCETRVSYFKSSWSTGREELLAWTALRSDVSAEIYPQTGWSKELIMAASCLYISPNSHILLLPLFNQNNIYSTTLRAVMWLKLAWVQIKFEDQQVIEESATLGLSENLGPWELISGLMAEIFLQGQSARLGHELSLLETVASCKYTQPTNSSLGATFKSSWLIIKHPSNLNTLS